MTLVKKIALFAVSAWLVPITCLCILDVLTGHCPNGQMILDASLIIAVVLTPVAAGYFILRVSG